MQEIKIKVGDPVIYSDGLKGKISRVAPETKFQNKLIIAEVLCEDGKYTYITKFQIESTVRDFYLIGSHVFGNKETESYIEQQIQDCDKRIEKIKQEKKQLRKQLWRLREEMVEDWRERKALRELKASYKQTPTEQQTED